MDKDWYGICERRKEKVLYWLHERRKAGTIQYMRDGRIGIRERRKDGI